MKKYIYILGLSLFMIVGCASKMKLEMIAPFSLGDAYAQKWSVETPKGRDGYEVVVTILSLKNDKAKLKNMYFKGKKAPVSILMTEKGIVGVAEFGDAADSIEDFPFNLTETQAIITYMQKGKLKYYKINGISQKLPISYPNLRKKNSR
ncbi:hypothetical protein [Zobellia nedashkovskayae]|uniref:hypothetical protein n=1 Tax=Zobellia nedashkovskayae TaxID=2779510 RepID=UPI00188CD9E9|nr:hypothetical protein [Zobellia nedashkovskayae]